MKRKTTARRSNPRYLISRDGVEVGIYPGFTSVEAVKRAKAQYGRGKYTAEKISADMYLGRGGEEIAARERLERQRQQRAERHAKPSGRKRNGTHIHADLIDHLDVAKVHNPDFDDMDDVWAAISGQPVINRSRTAPEGNYPHGLILEEYELDNDGGYLQVAFDPMRGGDPVEWHFSSTSRDSWYVG